MKLPVTLSIAACAGIAAFLLGRMNASGGVSDGGKSSSSHDAGPSSGTTRTRIVAEARRVPVKGRITAPISSITTEQASKLSREERLALLADGALIFNGGNQIAAQLGVIAALKKDEMEEATSIIGRAQNQGNGQSAEIWVALWTQWGRVNPEEAFERFKKYPQGKGPVDSRNVMEGWLEKDPAAAVAWAKDLRNLTLGEQQALTGTNQRGIPTLEAAAAALAISHEAGGDPEKLKDLIRGLPADRVQKEAMKDYFDLASLASPDATPAAIYDALPADLRAAAWPAALQRQLYEDPAKAAAWLSNHAGDPGMAYSATTAQVAREMAKQDTAAAITWASSLPGLGTTDQAATFNHPIEQVISTWIGQDAPGAVKWLQSQSEVPWARNYLRKLEYGGQGFEPAEE